MGVAKRLVASVLPIGAVLHPETCRIAPPNGPYALPNGPFGRGGHRLLCQNAWPERLLCISLHNTNCTRQSVSKLTLHSFEVHFHFQRQSVPAAQVTACRGQTTWQYMAKANSGIRQKGVLRAATALAGCFAAAGSPDSDSPGGQVRWL